MSAIIYTCYFVSGITRDLWQDSKGESWHHNSETITHTDLNLKLRPKNNKSSSSQQCSPAEANGFVCEQSVTGMLHCSIYEWINITVTFPAGWETPFISCMNQTNNQCVVMSTWDWLTQAYRHYTCLITHVLHLLTFHSLMCLMNVCDIFSPYDRP